MFTTTRRQPYTEFRYIYPARPEHPCPIADIGKYSTGYLAQPKLNGSNTLIFLNNEEYRIYNRHGHVKSNGDKLLNTVTDIIDLVAHNAGYMVLNGEFMDKSKKDENGNVFTGIVLYDILVHRDELLTGVSFADRIKLLYNVFRGVTGALCPTDHPLHPTMISGLYLVNTWETDFQAHYNRITPIDMYEGLVLKRKDQKLAFPTSPTANQIGQLKFRKPTKNYHL